MAKLSLLLFSVQAENIALLWLPAGLGLYLYSRQGTPALATIFIANFLGNFVSHGGSTLFHQILHTGISAGAYTLFAFIGGTLLNLRLHKGVNKPLDIFDFLLYCGLIPIAVSTTISGINLWWGGFLSGEDALVASFSTYIADLLGIMLIYPLFPAWERRHLETTASTWTWVIPALMALVFITGSFYLTPWLVFFALPALIYVVVSTKSLHSYAVMTVAVLLYNLMATRFMELSAVTVERLGVLAFSLSTTIAILAMAVQQRSLLAEKNLSQQWMISATHDSLTELPNRANIDFLIQHEIARLRRHAGTFTLAIIDIDFFKKVNDSYGHSAGDKVLVEMAHRLRNSFRKSDVVARYGGEEFLVLLQGTPLYQAHRLLDRVRTKLASQPIDLDGKKLQVTFSAGLAEFESVPDDNFGHLIKLADKRLYQAKHQGRNRVVSQDES